MRRSKDGKKTLPKAVAEWETLFMEGLKALKMTTRGAECGHISRSGAVSDESSSMLSTSASSTGTSAVYSKCVARDDNRQKKVLRLLDGAVGIRRIGENQYVGKTLTAHVGCKALPIYLVRPVEVEFVARRLNCTEMEIGRIQKFLSQLSVDSKGDSLAWDMKDVKNKESAIEYLMRATLMSNRFAKSVLQWLAPSKAQGIEPTLGAPQAEYIRAIRGGDRLRAIQLGTMIAGGETSGGPIRPDRTFVMAMPLREREAMAANNIGYLLLHGDGGVGQDVREAIQYYEMALRWGSAAAASNLGHVYYTGANGSIARDGQRAQQLYMLAVERGERSSAPRNMAVLLLHGAPGIKSDVSAAAHWLLLGLREGDEQARLKCERTMRLVLRCWRFKFVKKTLKRDCIAALHDVELERTDTFSGVRRQHRNDTANDALLEDMI